MAKRSKSNEALPPAVKRGLEQLGADIAVARKRRHIPLRQMAERMMVSLDTVQRLEKGEPGVGIGVVASALWVLGMGDRLSLLVDPARDQVGLARDLERLPKRVSGRRSSSETVSGTTSLPDLDF